MVELVTKLEVVGPQPARLEPRQILVKLVVLVQVERGVVEVEVGAGVARGLRERRIGRNRARASCRDPHSVADEIESGEAGGEAEIVIVLDEITKTGSRNQLRRDGDVATQVQGLVGRGKTSTALEVVDWARDRR